MTGDLADRQVEMLLALLAVDARPRGGVEVDPLQHRQVHRPQPLQRPQELGGRRAWQQRPALLVVARVFDFELSDEDMGALDGLDRTGGTDRGLERPWW